MRKYLPFAKSLGIDSDCIKAYPDVCSRYIEAIYKLLDIYSYAQGLCRLLDVINHLAPYIFFHDVKQLQNHVTRRKFESTRLLKSSYVRFIVNTKKMINNDSIMQSKQYFRHRILQSEN